MTRIELDCPKCEGEGYFLLDTSDQNGDHKQERMDCYDCFGSGRGECQIIDGRVVNTRGGDIIQKPGPFAQKIIDSLIAN